jgi:hypothetical protein
MHLNELDQTFVSERRAQSDLYSADEIGVLHDRCRSAAVSQSFWPPCFILYKTPDAGFMSTFGRRETRQKTWVNIRNSRRDFREECEAIQLARGAAPLWSELLPLLRLDKHAVGQAVRGHVAQREHARLALLDDEVAKRGEGLRPSAASVYHRRATTPQAVPTPQVQQQLCQNASTFQMRPQSEVN